MRKRLFAGLIVLAFGAALSYGGPTYGTSHLYPDLKTLSAKDLRFDVVTVGGSPHYVLRFSNTVWNAGEGPLEIRVTEDVSATLKKVAQRIYLTGGGYTQEPAGDLIWHEAHAHWHFEDFASYQLWSSANRTPLEALAGKKGQKASFCIIDTTRVANGPDVPKQPVYASCGWSGGQGLSVSWGDTYKYYLDEQWIDLGTTPLGDGEYAIRSIADPKPRLNEGGTIGGLNREANNDAWTFFSVQNGRIKVLR